MKKALTIYALLGALTLSAQISQAGFSEMQALEATGKFVGVKEASVTLVKARGEIQGIEINIDSLGDIAHSPFAETLGLDVSSLPASNDIERLKLFGITEDECGTIVYEAGMVDPQGFEPIKFLTLFDHSERFCEDFIPALWEAEFVDETGDYSLLRLRGNPNI